MEARQQGMQPLSKPLADWLLKLRLCTPADLRRCQGRVRQLARDVPAFDSVWIDALVHARKLTAFQAKLLESGRPEQLAVGPCVLVDQLGHGMSATYLARHVKGRERSVLKLIDLPEEERSSALAALAQLVARAEKLSHPSAIVPKACLYHSPHLVTVSRYLQGPSLNQLLVRRGRFPAPIVLALARQLVDGLAAMEECGIIHGELRLQNLRLGSGGYVVMLDAGIGPAIRPELNIRARISPEHYDGIAPERIGTGQPADGRSEFYSLGCLLWQLLAGRPPFTTGDPLAKLMAHQTRRVPDVREVAPDTPAEFAEILKVFTEPDPNRRPASFREFRDGWGKAKRSHRRRLARFRSLFNTAIPYVPAMRPEESPHRWPMVAAMLFLLSGAALGLMDAGATSALLDIPNRIEKYLNSPQQMTESQESKPPTNKTKTIPLGKPLPKPDAQGLIELTEPGPYRWSNLKTVGPLTLRATAGLHPVIMIEKTPGECWAADVVLENLHFRWAGSGSTNSLLQIASRSLVLRNCRFDLEKSNPSTAGVQWRHIDRSHPLGGRVALENCVLTAAGQVCRFADWPRQIVVKNCLKTGPGVMFDFPKANHAEQNLEWDLSHVTLRGASGLVRCDVGADAKPGSWLIRAENCVFDLAGKESAVFQIAGAGVNRFFAQFQLQGLQVLLSDNGHVAAWLSPADKTLKPIDSSALNVEGLVLAKFSFAGRISSRPADSELKTWQGPRFSSSTPGIVPALLPESRRSLRERSGSAVR